VSLVSISLSLINLPSFSLVLAIQLQCFDHRTVVLYRCNATQIWCLCLLATTLNVTRKSPRPHGVATAQRPDGHRLTASGTISHGHGQKIPLCRPFRYGIILQFHYSIGTAAPKGATHLCVCVGINGNRIMRTIESFRYTNHRRGGCRRQFFGFFSFSVNKKISCHVLQPERRASTLDHLQRCKTSW
jgi:hypothetical protein